MQSFSIDDILSHKTAELQQQAARRHHHRLIGDDEVDEDEEEDSNTVTQPIVRPWDIGKAGSAFGIPPQHAAAMAAAAAAAAAASSSSPASSTTESPSLAAGGDRRKSVGDSPLDALFQMASKTFEGLKAKSGKN